jgi:hypothetical protein
MQYLLASAAVGRGWSGYLVTLCDGLGATVPTGLYALPYMCSNPDDPTTVRRAPSRWHRPAEGARERRTDKGAGGT